jgi:hypothetical protein
VSHGWGCRSYGPSPPFGRRLRHVRRAVVGLVNSSRTQNGHIRNDTRDERLVGDGGPARYDFAAPAFAFRDVVSDEAGLVLEYLGLAVRVV